MVGLIAMAALQADRVVVGTLLSLEQSGLYFRHMMLASFAYQIFNVASYNRIAPKVYGYTTAGQPWLAKGVIRRELNVLVPLAALLVGLFYAANQAGVGNVKALQAINPHYLATLTLGYLIRAFADFNALQLNAVYSERHVFIAQACAVCLTIVVNVLLTEHFGIAGSIVTLVLGSTAYLIASGFFTRRSPSLNVRETS